MNTIHALFCLLVSLGGLLRGFVCSHDVLLLCACSRMAGDPSSWWEYVLCCYVNESYISTQVYMYTSCGFTLKHTCFPMCAYTSHFIFLLIFFCILWFFSFWLQPSSLAPLLLNQWRERKNEMAVLFIWFSFLSLLFIWWWDLNSWPLAFDREILNC